MPPGYPSGVMHATTIIGVRHNGSFALAGDGQVTLGHTVVKSSACKIRHLAGGQVLAGFAGATADAFTLLERFEQRLDACNRQLARAAEALARDWRTDRILRRLEAMLIIADSTDTLVLSGVGDVLQPENGIAAIGSGAAYAEAAALALTRHAPAMSSADIARTAIGIAADICIYTNHQISVKELAPSDRNE